MGGSNLLLLSSGRDKMQLAYSRHSLWMRWTLQLGEDGWGGGEGGGQEEQFEGKAQLVHVRTVNLGRSGDGTSFVGVQTSCLT